jgi:endo-1,4-beta-D-glucanase Y
MLFCLSALTSAQQYPFPQNLKYPNAFLPKTLTSDRVKSEYTRWLSKAVTTCSSTSLYVNIDGVGKVEAVGFGALTFAYMGDKTRFDAIYNFYKTNCNSGSAGGMMGWQGHCNGSSDGCATDGEIDVAFALIVASWQWPDGGYLEKARAIMTNMKKLIVTCSGLTALAMGVNFGGCSMTDISYYNPAAFREFAKVVGNATDSAMWVKLADDTYTILNAGANATTGLVPDRQSTSGAANGSYAYDACRTPWRITLDYLWNGNEKAKTWCKKISDFAYKFGISNIKSGFSLSGSSSGGWHDMCFVGGFAIAAMANSQTMVDEFGTDLMKVSDNAGFTLSLTPCYLLTFTGNQWRPDLLNPANSKQNRNNPAALTTQHFWKLLENRELSLTGVKSGYSISVTDLTGKKLIGTTAVSEKASIDLSKMKAGCVILTITDKSNTIIKKGRISIM